MYLQRPQNKSRTASIIFYALCVLYALSTVNVVVDLVTNIPIIGKVSNNLSVYSVVPKNFYNLQLESLTFTLYIPILQTTVNGCCDFLAQCILVRILSHSVVPIIRFIHLNLQRSTVVGSCGVKLSVS